MLMRPNYCRNSDSHPSFSFFRLIRKFDRFIIFFYIFSLKGYVWNIILEALVAKSILNENWRPAVATYWTNK